MYQRQNFSAACGSPCSICDKIRVTSDMVMKIASGLRRRQKMKAADHGGCPNQRTTESQKTFLFRLGLIRSTIAGLPRHRHSKELISEFKPPSTRRNCRK